MLLQKRRKWLLPYKEAKGNDNFDNKCKILYNNPINNIKEAGSKVILARSFFSVIFPLLPANLEKIIFVRKNPLCSPTTFPICSNIGNKKSLPVAIFRFSGNILP